MTILSDSTPNDVPARIWHAKNSMVGIIVGFIAWGMHNKFISKVEDYLSTKSTTVNAMLNKPPTDPPQPPPSVP